MRGSADMVWRMDGRTDTRTDERESIGPSANADRPKINGLEENGQKRPKTI